MDVSIFGMENYFSRRGGYPEVPVRDVPEIYVVRTCKKQTCWRARKKGAKLLCLALIYVVFVVCNVLTRMYNENHKQEEDTNTQISRVRRDAAINNNGSLGQGRFS